MLGIADYPAFCTAIVVFLAIPGPGNFALLRSTGHGGLRAGLAAMMGVIAGDQVLLWLAVAGVAALLETHPAWFNALRWGGVAYLAWIGWKLLRARPGEDASPVNITPGHYFRQSLVITLLNPKAIIFYMAFFPLFIDPATHQGLPTFGAMAATIAAITAAYCIAVCALADQLAARIKRHPQVAQGLQKLAGLCMIGFGLRLLRD